MKKYLLIASALMAALAVSSCDNIKEEDTSLTPGEIKFSASIGKYNETKVTGNVFDTGDKVGLFVGEPLNISNELLTWNGSAFVPENTLYWAAGQQGKSLFRAYYPYNEELTQLTGKIPFPVKENQSTQDKYSRSDLMASSVQAGPEDDHVHLSFNHLLSRLVVKLDNQSGEAIKEVRIAGFKTSAIIDCDAMAADGVLNDDSDDQYLYPAILTDGSADYAALIVPPQQASFGVLVTLESGRIEVFTSKATFVAGKQSQGTVVVPEMAVGDEVEFLVSVEEWDESGEVLRFRDGEFGTRSGWWGRYWPKTGGYYDFEMEEKSPGAFYINFPEYKEGDYFVLANDGDRYIVGVNLAIPQPLGDNNNEWPAERGGMCQVSGFEGDLGVWFYPDDGIIKYEPVYPKWKSIGTGLLVNDLLNILYGLSEDTMPRATDVEVYEDERHPGNYRITIPVSRDWEEYEYYDVNELFFDATDPEKVYLKKNGFIDWEWNYWTLGSAVPENGVGADEVAKPTYGTLENGVITLGMLKREKYNGDVWYFTVEYFQLVLPGYERKPVFSLAYSYDGYHVDEADGLTYAGFTIYPFIDVENIRYAVYSGKLSYEEANGEVLDYFRNGGGESIDFPHGHVFGLNVPIAKSGNYSFFLYADSPSSGENYWLYYYRYFSVEVDGAPEPEIEITVAEPFQMFPEKALLAHVNSPNSNAAYIRVIPKAVAEDAGLTEDYYFDYAYKMDYKSFQATFFSGTKGQDFVVTNLKPNTEYLIIAASIDEFGQTAYAWKTATTGSAPETWEEVGTGTWYDNSFTEGYMSPVKVLKASGTERYRAVQPYAAFWEKDYPLLLEEKPDDYENTYIGYSSDVDFFFVEDQGASFIYYDSWLMGMQNSAFAEEGSEAGYLDFHFYDLSCEHPALHPYIKYNRALSQGVYNLAPYVDIRYAGRYYNCMSMLDGIVLAMPGYEYTPEFSIYNAAPARRNYVEWHEGDPAPAIVTGEHTVKPFKKLPLSFGKAKIENK